MKSPGSRPATSERHVQISIDEIKRQCGDGKAYLGTNLSQPLRIRPDRRVTVGLVTIVPEYPGVTSYAMAAW